MAGISANNIQLTMPSNAAAFFTTWSDTSFDFHNYPELTVGLFRPECNPASGLIVGCHSEFHFIPWHDFDLEHAHLS